MLTVGRKWNKVMIGQNVNILNNKERLEDEN